MLHQEATKASSGGNLVFSSPFTLDSASFTTASEFIFQPAGHAYAAAISACAAGGEWEQAVKLFNEMMSRNIKPDVVSCTALITALAADGQWRHAENVMEFMIQSGKQFASYNAFCSKTSLPSSQE